MLAGPIDHSFGGGASVSESKLIRALHHELPTTKANYSNNLKFETPKYKTFRLSKVNYFSCAMEQSITSPTTTSGNTETMATLILKLLSPKGLAVVTHFDEARSIQQIY